MPERDEFLKKLAPLVTRPEWDMFLVYITNKLNEERENLEHCNPESLRATQARAGVYRDLLTLRDTIAKLIK